MALSRNLTARDSLVRLLRPQIRLLPLLPQHYLPLPLLLPRPSPFSLHRIGEIYLRLVRSVQDSTQSEELVSWLSWEEWDSVRESLFSSSPDRVASTLERVATWRSRGSLPAHVDVTCSLIEIQLKDGFIPAFTADAILHGNTQMIEIRSGLPLPSCLEIVAKRPQARFTEETREEAAAATKSKKKDEEEDNREMSDGDDIVEAKDFFKHKRVDVGSD